MTSKAKKPVAEPKALTYEAVVEGGRAMAEQSGFDQPVHNARAREEPAAVWLETSALTPWDRNPRRNDENVARVAASIKRFGFASPIIARAADMTIIAGHTRWKAAQSLGLDRVPVRLLDLDPAEAHLLALADNRLNEPIFYGWAPGAAHYFIEDRTQTSVLAFPKPSRSEEHPTMKPIALIAKCLQNSTKPGALVVEPFGGSGTTLIACEQLGRVCNAIELSPIYCDVILKRWEQLTGADAVRA